MKTSVLCCFAVFFLLFASSTALAQLVGGNTYPINGTENPPTSFATMKSAAAYLNANGVTGTGDVVLQFTTGYVNETDTVGIRAIAGTGPSTRVVFRPASGFTVNMTFTPPSTTNPFVIRIINSSNIVLDGRQGGIGTTRSWTITATGSGTAGTGRSAVIVSNANASVSNITLRYLTMIGEAANVTGGILQLTGSTANVMSNVTIEENLIRSTATSSLDTRGLGIEIASSISNAANTGMVIRNNEITQFYQRAISFSGACPDARIYGNKVYHLTPITQPTTAEFSAIYYSNSSVNGVGTEIYNNMVYDIRLKNASITAAAPISGIHFNLAPTSGTPIRVYNNFVSIGQNLDSIAATYQVVGIRENTSTAALLDFYFNSVYVGGDAASGSNHSAAFRKQLSTNLNVFNNVFFNARSNSGGTGTHWGIMVNNTTFASIGKNDYFANGTGGVLGTTDGTPTGNRATLGDWNTAVPTDVGSVSQNPNYLNPTATPANLHINTTIPSQLESGGTPVTGITTDIDGDTRNVSTPDIGADEFNGIGADFTPPLISYTTLANTHLTSNRTLLTTITDASGVQRSVAGAPRLWFKKGAAGAYQQVSGVNVGDDFTFTVDHSLVGGVVTGDTVFYYVAAQDSLNNSGSNPGGTSPTINPPNATVANPNLYRIVPSYSGPYTIGTGGQFLTVKAFFDALNDGFVTGNVTATIISDITETATASLNQLNEFPTSSNFTLSLAPIGAIRTITGTVATALIELNGADRVTINGNIGGTKSLTLRNTSTTGAAVRFINDATNNVVMNCTLESGITSTTSGVVAFSTAVGGTTGNSNNTVDNNVIRDRSDSTGVPANLIYSSGTTAAPNGTNTISNNIMFNFTVNGLNLTATGAGNNWTINNNKVYQTANRTTALGGFRVLGGNGHSVTNNSIGGSAADRSGAPLTTSSTFSGIVMTVGTTEASSVQGNRIGNIDATAATSVGISVTTGNVNIGTVSGNYVGGATAAYDTIVVRNTADMITTSSTGTVNIHNNVVGNIRHLATSSIRFSGIGATNGRVTIVNNTVRDIYSTSIGTTTSLIPIGIYVTAIDSNSNIMGNQIYNMHLAPTGTGAYTIVGIYVDEGTGSAGTTTVRRNLIYNISNAATGTGATGPRVVGISPRTGNVSYYNNMISLGEGTTGDVRVYGIEDLSGATTTPIYVNKFYYNSVLITGTQTGDNASFAFRRGSTLANPAADTIRNNIFANTRTGGLGGHFAIGNTTTANWGSGTSNNNLFFTADQNTMGQWLTAGGNLDAWRAASGGDALSRFGNPQFETPTNLHIQTGAGSPADSAGTPIAGITTDFDGDTRSATFPDAGADEFVSIPPDRDLRMTIVIPPTPPIQVGQAVQFKAVVDNLSLTTTENSYTVNWLVDATPQTPVVRGPLAPGATDSVPLPWTAAFGQHSITAIVSVAGNPNPSNDTARVDVFVNSVIAGGTYTVGTTSGAFHTLKSAFDSVNASIVMGNIVLSVLNEGTNESAVAELNQVTYGPGGPYSITIKPASGASPTITGNIPEFVVKFNGADNVVIDGSNTVSGTTRDLTIENTTQTNNSGVFWLVSQGVNAGAENITIKNCNIAAGRADTNNTLGVFAAGPTISTASGGQHNNNLIVENNNFTRTRFAVYSRGIATTGIQTGLVIRNNIMGSETPGREVNYRAIDIGQTDSALVSGNQIFNMLQPQNLTITAIHVDAGVTNAMIAKNRISKVYQSNTGTFGALGININSTTTSNITIVNNMISDLICDGGGTSTASNPFGIRIAGGTNHKVYYNSVSLSGAFFNATTSDLSAAFIVTVSTATGLDMRNNIFSNTMTGGGTTTCYGIYAVSAATVFGTINNNDYYVAGPNGILGRQGTTAVLDLPSWRTFTGQDVNSISSDPVFLNPATNLHINTAGPSPVDSAGTPIAGITTDIDGDTRNATKPDIGADEFSPIPPPPVGWTVQTSGVTSLLYSVSAVSQNVGWASGASGVVLRTTDGGTTWTSVGGGPLGTAQAYAIAGIDANTAVVSTTPGGGGSGTFIFKTTNGGGAWTQVFTDPDAAAFINAIKMFNATTGIAQGDPVGGKWMILKTTDGGSSWARIPTEPNQAGTEAGAINGLATFGTTHIWFTPGSGSANIYRSTDAGLTWAFSTLPFTAFTGGLAFNDPLYGVAGASGGQAARTTDGGVTWTSVTMPGTGAIYDITGSGVDFFAPRGTSVYRSTDRGATWALSFTPSPTIGTFRGISFITSGSFTRGWGVTSTGGIAGFYGNVTDVRQEGLELPTAFELSQNYPNPFNPSTTIRFALPVQSSVILKIYNILGQEIATLIDGEQPAGYFTTEWRGKNQFGTQVASGVYFFRLEARPSDGGATFTSLKKMLLLK